MTRYEWIAKCTEWKDKWPVYSEEFSDDTDGINIYTVLETLNSCMSDKNIIVADAGSPSYACPVALKATNAGQFIFNPSQADMGWAVPASIGISLNALDKTTIVIVGDGSFYSNSQELAVIRQHNLPIKVLVLNNNGYLSIRNTQSKYYEGRVYGVDSNSGLYLPEIYKIARAYDLEYRKVWTTQQITAVLAKIINDDKPEIIEIVCQQDQEIVPAQAIKVNEAGYKVQAPLQDMYPFLSEEELKAEWPE